MKRLEDNCFAQKRWGEAKAYAEILLDAMKELAPVNDGRGVLSALSDLRKICYKSRENHIVDAKDVQVRLRFSYPLSRTLSVGDRGTGLRSSYGQPY